MQDKLKNLKLPRQTPLILIGVGLLFVSVITVLLLSPKDPRTEEEKLADELSFDVTEETETIPDSISSTINNNPHKDYQTDLTETKYFGLTAQEFCSSLHTSCTNIMSQKLTKITVINSNILNYYLDQGLAIIISSPAKTTVIYGALYSIPSYIVFTIDQTDFDSYTYASRVDLFNNLTGSETFYTINPS